MQPVSRSATQMLMGDRKEISQWRTSHMTRVTAAIASLVVAAYAPGSPAQEDDLASAAPPERRLPSDWSFEFGGGSLALPSFPGAASTKVIPLPWVDLHYKDRLFLSPISGLGVNLVRSPGHGSASHCCPTWAARLRRTIGFVVGATSGRERTSGCSGNCASSARSLFSPGCASSSAEATERWWMAD